MTFSRGRMSPEGSRQRMIDNTRMLESEFMEADADLTEQILTSRRTRKSKENWGNSSIAKYVCSFPLLFRILNRLGGFCLLRWLFPVECLDWGFEYFDVEAEVWFDLVVPVDVLVYGFELVAFLFVDAVEAFQLPVGFP